MSSSLPRVRPVRFLPGIVLSAALALLLGHGCDRYEVQQPVNNPPTAPANPSPASDSTTVVESLVPILSWEGGDDPDQDAVVFDIAMGTALPLGALATTDERHLDLDLALRLPGDAVVLWQVVARDARGASAAGPLWTFRTGTDGNRPPTPLGSPVPADGDTGVATDALLQWFGGEDPEGGTVRYTARIDTLEDFSSPAAQVDSTLGDRRYRPATELLAHTLYYWQVTADDTVGARRTGDVWSFATGSGPTAANEPPDPVGGPIPADGLAGVSVTHPALRWAGGLDPDGDPVVFSVYLGTGGDLQLLGTTTEKRLDLPTHLAFATIHDWRVDAADDHGHVTPGPVWSFSTEVNDPPTPITDPSPVDGATDQPTDVDIAWQGGLDPEDLELEYALYLGTDGQPLELVTMTTQHSVPMGIHGPLAHDTTYRWRVDAIDSEGLVTASDTWSFATVPDGAPSAPCAPVTPASGATGIGASVMLTWSCGIDPEGDPVTYDVLLGTGLPLTDPVASGLTSRSHMLSDLPAHTLHYWQARATDGATPPVAGPIWWFTTANTPPGMVSDPTPVDTAVEVALDEDLGWAAAVDADGDTVTYRVLLDLVSPPVTELGTTALTTIDAGTLEELTTYSWRVVAEDGFGGFSPGPIWRFTTAERPNRAPEAASAPGPPDHATDVGLDVVLTWTGSDPDGDDLIYDVHLGTGDPPPLLFTTINAFYDPLGDLPISTEFYWQITSRDDGGLETAGPVWSFTTGLGPNQPPPAPTGESPADGAVDVAVDVTLSWEASIDPDGDSVVYDVYFGTTGPPAFLLTTSATSYDPPGDLDHETVHLWQLVVRDGRGGAAATPIWSFTTGPEPNQPPSAPQPVSPAAGATGVPVSTTVVWQESIDPEGDGVLYEVYFGTGEPPPYVATQPGTTYDPPGELAFETRYVWRVRAVDTHGAATWGDQRDFTTETAPNQPPPPPSAPDPASGATGVDPASLLAWAASIDPDGDPVTYDVYLGTTSPLPLVASDQPVPSYDPGGLAPVTFYHWQVVAKDDRGGEASSSVWGFITGFP